MPPGRPPNPPDPIPAGRGPGPASEPPPRRGRFRTIVRVVELRLRFVLLMAVTGAVFGSWDRIQSQVEKWARPPRRPAVALGEGFEGYCPMHPGVRGDSAGSCPTCGMPLSRRRKGAAEALPEGVLSRVRLSPGRVAQAGIRTAEVAYAPLTRTVSTLGEVGFDQTRLASVAYGAKGMARVDAVEVGSVGDEVRAGQPLAELFGLELSQGIRDLLVARRAAPRFADDRVRQASEALRVLGVRPSQIEAILARDRDDYRLPVLAPIDGSVVKKDVVEGQYVAEGALLFQVADLGRVWVHARVDQHDLALVRVGQPITATVPALPGEEFSGRVSSVAPLVDPASRTAEVRYVLDNAEARLRPGMSARVTLTVRVADVPEVRSRIAAARAAAGTTRRASLGPGEQRTCPVSRRPLGSMGDPIRVEVEGRAVWLCCEGCRAPLKASPARYLARLEPPPEDGVLSVPESAVIDTGSLRVVYVEAAPGVFEGRAVVLGPRAGDRYAVLEGLAPGERVADAGAFLIDAETRLNPATRAGDLGGEGTP